MFYFSSYSPNTNVPLTFFIKLKNNDIIKRLGQFVQFNPDISWGFYCVAAIISLTALRLFGLLARIFQNPKICLDIGSVMEGLYNILSFYADREFMSMSMDSRNQPRF